MSNEELEIGKQSVVEMIEKAASEFDVQVTNLEWNQSSIDFDELKWTLAYFITDKRYIEKFSEDELEDCQGDSSVRENLETRIKQLVKSKIMTSDMKITKEIRALFSYHDLEFASIGNNKSAHIRVSSLIGEVAVRLKQEVFNQTGNELSLLFEGDFSVNEFRSDEFTIAFFPIITPGYFDDENCKHELESIIELEQTLNKENFVQIFPIYLIDTVEMRERDHLMINPLVSFISHRKYYNLQKLVYDPLDTPSVQKEFILLANNIKEVFQLGNKSQQKMKMVDSSLTNKNKLSGNQIKKKLNKTKKGWMEEPIIKQAPISEEKNEDSTFTAAPTPKVVSDQWVQEDDLGYLAFARAIAGMITHEETKPPLTIGIKAPWGAGKTSLMKMVQYMLDGHASVTEENIGARFNEGMDTTIKFKELFTLLEGNSNFKKPKLSSSKKGEQFRIPPRATVWFNAWKYQGSDQVWAGMAHCIITQVTSRMSANNRELFWLRLNKKRINTSTLRMNLNKVILEEFLPKGLVFIVAAVFSFILFPIFDGAMKIFPLIATIAASVKTSSHWNSLKEDKNDSKISGVFRDVVRQPDYEGKMGYLHLVESDIRDVMDLVATPENPLVIFVDDLDRCAPRKVAEIVEAINLFLCGDYPNCIFILGMDPSIVAASLEVANKELIEKLEEFLPEERKSPLGWRFMEKIVQLPLVIPPPTSEGMQSYINALTGTTQPQNTEAIEKQHEQPREEIIQNYMSHYEKATSVSKITEITDNLFKDVKPEEKNALAEASKRKYSEKFTDRDPAIKNFVKSAVDTFHANPRQIKRYINLFRFSCNLRHYVYTDYLATGKEVPYMPTDEVLTKFVALAVHWPQSLDFLRRTVDIKSKDSKEVTSVSILSVLEGKARFLSSKNNDSVVKDWESYISDNGYDVGDWIKQISFCKFLASGASFSDSVNCGIW